MGSNGSIGSNERVQVHAYSSTKTLNHSPSGLAQGPKALARSTKPLPNFSSHTSPSSSFAHSVPATLTLRVFFFFFSGLTRLVSSPGGLGMCCLPVPPSITWPTWVDPFGLHLYSSQGGLPCLFSSGPTSFGILYLFTTLPGMRPLPE